MQGKAVVITGGAGGLGGATAEMMAARGARIAIVDIAEDALRERVEELNRQGHQVVGIQGDVTVQSEAAALFDQAVQAFGRVHVLVNCAGVYPRVPILEITDEAFDRSFAVNVRGTHNMMIAAVVHMQPHRDGRVVNITSVDAFKAHPQNAHYASMKAAVASLTKSFALAFAADQILINSVAPGAIVTRRMTPEVLEEFSQATPLGRCAEPEDIAEMICFLASRANRYTTGENVVVSGGYVMV